MDSSRLVFTPSIAGVWNFVSDSYVTASNGGSLANSFFGNAGLGADQRMGVVMIGWQYSGFDNSATSVVPVNLGILEQQNDGTLLLDTASYVSSAVTHGGGSVVVADFNEDGRDDVFLAAHNESPFLLQPSTVLLSNAQGTFTKLTLNDAVMAHHAGLAWVGDKPVVVTASFAEDYEHGRTSPTYQWNGSGFTETEGTTRNSTGTNGMSVALGDLDGNGDLEMVIGDVEFGLGIPYNPANKFKIALYNANAAGTDITGTGPLGIITPYFEARDEYDNVYSTWGAADTHSYRVWLDDFNHDGKLDILAGQSLWTQANNSWPSMLQMLQNQGAFNFEDVSDRLNPDFDKDTGEIDYNMQIVDVDGSGIDSYLSGDSAPVEFNGQQWVALNSRHANWLLVNDGTGRLHVALHDEFIAMGQQAVQYAASIYNNAATLFVSATQATPRLHGYLTLEGKLSFVAEVSAFKMVGNVGYSNTSVLVNVPVQVDLATDFTDAIVIEDRNDSMLMRTFAGDDTIHDGSHAASASIDGGLGVDTAVYSLARGAYTVSASQGDWLVSRAGIADTLHRIERLHFSDIQLAMDMAGNAGVVAKTLGAVFGAAALQNEIYAGIGLDLVDDGMSASALMDLAITVKLGAGATHAAVVELLYFNVVGVHPSFGELASFQSLLDSGAYTPASLGLLAADTALNLANIGFAQLAVSGLEYI